MNLKGINVKHIKKFFLLLLLLVVVRSIAVKRVSFKKDLNKYIFCLVLERINVREFKERVF